MAPSHRYPMDPPTSRVTLRGNTVVNGANTFATGTGTVSLNGATTVADSPLNGKHRGDTVSPGKTHGKRVILLRKNMQKWMKLVIFLGKYHGKSWINGGFTMFY